MSTTESVDAVTAAKDWLAANWDPDLTVGEWWERFGTAGWAAPMLPETAYGKGLSRAEVVRVQEAVAEFGALPAPGGLGLLRRFGSQFEEIVVGGRVARRVGR